MNPFLWWGDSLQVHASDADYRKSVDPNESPRHYIDIDNYPEFIANGRIPQSLDSLIMLHGYTFVYDNGILPFAAIAWADSVKKYFLLRDWQNAMLKAADLGHYIGDAHNPLHITRNYDGQYTNQNGVHSRYETNLINRYNSIINYGGENVNYIQDINNHVFGFIYSNYVYVDSVLKADSIAKAQAGSYNDNYYQIFWNRAGNFTVYLLKQASKFLAELIYTSWVNAGSPLPTAVLVNNEIAYGYSLGQNCPNPFNPDTRIKFSVPSSSLVKIVVYNSVGSEVRTLEQGTFTAGTYETEFDGSGLPSGIYYYRLTASGKSGTASGFTQTKKMILVK